MPATKSKKAKRTVFLSHSSSNRRELMALKRALDERSGGFLEFFLSSDDDSIGHGKIWPEEVRAALDRMDLMLIFVSAEALKSGWTYFEAGFGLHKLGSAKIYCLPGTDKAALPSPFDILQNRNLHSAQDLTLLVQQINEEFGARMVDMVSKDDFDRIFRKPAIGRVETGPKFDQLVEFVKVETFGSPDSAEEFSRVCRNRGLPVGVVAKSVGSDERYSTGVRMKMDIPWIEETNDELEITDQIRKAGEADVDVFGDTWFVPKPKSSWHRRESHSLQEIEAYNAKIRNENERIERENEERRIAPRECTFVLSPIDLSLPVSIVDAWMIAVGLSPEITVEVTLLESVHRESRVEAISAKLHGSSLLLQENGSLLWMERIFVTMNHVSSGRIIALKPAAGENAILSQFHIEDLIKTLFGINILSISPQQRSKRRL